MVRTSRLLILLCFLLFSLEASEIQEAKTSTTPLAPLGFYNAVSSNHHPEQTAQVFGFTNQADQLINYQSDGKYQINSGQVEEGTRKTSLYSLEELKPLLSLKKCKDFVVVYFDKLTMTKDYEAIAAEQSKIMQEIGYKRVVVLGASGMGVHYIADTQLELIQRLKEK